MGRRISPLDHDAPLDPYCIIIIYLPSRSPATNKHYLAQPHGEIYGLDHSMERFQPGMLAKLRPETDIPGLFLSGQDVFIAGFMGMPLFTF